MGQAYRLGVQAEGKRRAYMPPQPPTPGSWVGNLGTVLRNELNLCWSPKNLVSPRSHPLPVTCVS